MPKETNEFTEGRSAIDEDTEEYTEILKKFLLVHILHVAVKVMTRESYLRGAERLSMKILRGRIWFTIHPQVQSPQVSKLILDDPILFEELSKQIGSRYVDIKDSSIKKSEECAWADFPGYNVIIKDDYRLQ